MAGRSPTPTYAHTHTHSKNTDEYDVKVLEKRHEQPAMLSHTQRWHIPLQWSVVGWYPFVHAPRRLNMWPCICHSIHLRSAEGDESHDPTSDGTVTLVLTSLTNGEATELKCHLRG